MSDHSWTTDNLASYVAGGLEAAERDRLDQHVGTCAACQQALAEAKSFDRELVSLFVTDRPRPGLEDRMIQSLRVQPAPAPKARTIRLPVALKFGLAAAAVVLLAVLGSFVEEGSIVGNKGTSASREIAAWDPPPRNQGLTLGSRGPETKGNADDVAWSMHQRIMDRRTNAEKLNDEIKDLERDNANADPGVDAPPVMGVTPGYGGWGVAGGAPMNGGFGGGPGAGGLGNQFYYNNSFVGGGGFAGNNFGGGFGGVPPATPGLRPQVDSIFLGDAQTKGGQGGQGGNNNDVDRFVPAERDREKIEPAPEMPAPQPKDPAASDLAPEPTAEKPGEPPPAENAPPARKVIRTGEMEFEVDSFESAVERIQKIVGEEKGLIGSMESSQQPNGKTQGTITVRVPPERLETLLLKLRALGELKRQRLGSRDITLVYNDTQAKLDAARVMEKRLLKIIEEAKGQIKDLLAAEKELGEWQTRIKSYESEIRTYNSQIALATLTIHLFERSITTPFAVQETERIDMGIETEDVDKAYRAAQAAVAEAKGRVFRSELKQPQPGAFNAVLHFEVKPEAAGPLRDRLHQLGKVARLEVDRQQQAEGGSGAITPNVKVEHKLTNFFVSIYNASKLKPRETVQLGLVTADVAANYQAVLNVVRKASGQVMETKLDRKPGNASSAEIKFHVQTDNAGGVLADILTLGEEINRQVVEATEQKNLTEAKRGFVITLAGFAHVMPRESSDITLATRQVPAAFQEVREAARAAGAWIQVAQLSELTQKHMTALLQFDVPRDKQAAIEAALARAGDIYTRNVGRATDTGATIDSRVGYTVRLTSDIVPRELITLGLKVDDVEQTVQSFKGLVAERDGLMLDQPISQDPYGVVSARLKFDVPLSAAAELVEKFRAAGTVSGFNVEPNPVPASKQARAFLEVTISNQPLVPTTEGPVAQLQSGLKNSFLGFAWSLKLIAIGTIFLLPWLVVAYGVYRLYRSLHRTESEPPAAAPPPAAMS
ncbi:MAG: DUF4349 domain-containing protein [Gemmataceae bacterium]